MRRPILIGVAIVAVVVLVAASVAYASAVSRANRVAETGSNPLPARAHAAALVKRLQPWNGSADVRYAMLEGRLLYNAHQWDASDALLYTTFLRHQDNKPLRAELRVVNLAIMFRDAGKAHVQHGHEGPKGTLGPQDYVP